jgi:hypothetical protein
LASSRDAHEHATVTAVKNKLYDRRPFIGQQSLSFDPDLRKPLIKKRQKKALDGRSSPVGTILGQVLQNDFLRQGNSSGGFQKYLGNMKILGNHLCD